MTIFKIKYIILEHTYKFEREGMPSLYIFYLLLMEEGPNSAFQLKFIKRIACREGPIMVRSRPKFYSLHLFLYTWTNQNKHMQK